MKSSNFKGFFNDVRQILNKPVPLPEVFTTPLFESTQNKPKKQIQAKDQKPKQAQFCLEGILKVGQNSEFSINGEDFIINHETWIVGDVEYGKKAKVQGLIKPAVAKVARKVTIIKE